MASGPSSCEWPMATARTGPQTCGHPTKATASASWHRNGYPLLVCGVHANTAVRQGWRVRDDQ